MPNNDRDIQAPWVGKSEDDCGSFWETEEEEAAYDEYIDRLIDEKLDEEYFEREINKHE